MPAPADYIEVKDRLAKFFAEHPDGWFDSKYTIERIGDQTFVVVVSTVYPSESATAGAVGMAWEPVPGKTNFTRDSELMNAETSAWGRALIAGGYAEAKQGIASANEVRNRQAAEPPKVATTQPDLAMLRARIAKLPEGEQAELRQWCKEAHLSAKVPAEFVQILEEVKLIESSHAED